ncbi:MAG: hypothetical protein Ct9H90mP4_05510 [Gammaproteobacteria bacterium]|nr:MAG: hypothetical protein Ct9H90mP4_05510 [Gammaproteobacteria bacterium]
MIPEPTTTITRNEVPTNSAFKFFLLVLYSILVSAITKCSSLNI